MKTELAARAALNKLIEDAGGSRVLARQLGCTRQAVEAWEVIPLTYIRDTWRLYGLGLNELRPDIAELARLK